LEDSLGVGQLRFPLERELRDAAAVAPEIGVDALDGGADFGGGAGGEDMLAVNLAPERDLAGIRATTKPVLLLPVGVVTRQSSDAIAVSDPVIARAMRYIRDHAAEGINVADVARQLPVNRRTFERKFAVIVGRSPLAEIIRDRLERAKQLLATTELPMSEVSQQAGFRDAGHLWSAFRAEHRPT
jgi:AraC-like DNA-binding protein